MLFEMTGKRMRGEMLQAGAIVAHDVLRARQVLGAVAVAVLTLVGASDLAQTGGRAGLGHSSFSGSAHSSDVVTKVVQSGVLGVVAATHDVELG
jgi:hypothetical protein